jgi:hypothetical protein
LRATTPPFSSGSEAGWSRLEQHFAQQLRLLEQTLKQHFAQRRLLLEQRLEQHFAQQLRMPLVLRHYCTKLLCCTPQNGVLQHHHSDWKAIAWVQLCSALLRTHTKHNNCCKTPKQQPQLMQHNPGAAVV